MSIRDACSVGKTIISLKYCLNTVPTAASFGCPQDLSMIVTEEGVIFSKYETYTAYSIPRKPVS